MSFLEKIKISYLLIIINCFWALGIAVLAWMGSSDLSRLAATVQGVHDATMERHYLKLALFIIVVGGSFTHLVYTRIRAKLDDTMERLKDMVSGETDLTKRIPLRGATEIDEISGLVNDFLERMQELIKKVKERGIETAEHARQIRELSESLAATAVEGQAQSEEVSQLAKLVGDEMGSIAAAMEEMTATVTEIAQHTVTTSQQSAEALEEVERAKELVGRLGDASAKIGQMSALIGTIAEQTNLLALNATIEAARAGEAGKGFAVVANEVKELAGQTGDAVKQIEDNVTELQNYVDAVIQATDAIAEVVSHVNDLAGNVSAAVEEQTATTNEISKNAQTATARVADLTNMSEGIKEAAGQTAAGAEQAKSTARELNEVATALKEYLQAFTV